MRTFSKVTVAAVQAGPVFLNMEASVNKACELIGQAAARHAKLVAFPQAFLPGYPHWSWCNDPISVMPFTQMIFAQALKCPGDELKKISQCAKENDIYVCITATEREGSTCYQTQFFFDNKGNLIGKHRLTKPMSVEKEIWGEGDMSTMKVMQTPFGRIGGLIGAEHFMPAELVVMCEQTEEIHIASFPTLPSKPINFRTLNPYMTAAQNYAVSNNCFVIGSTEVVNKDVLEMLGNPGYAEKLPTSATSGLGGGNSFILDPNGEIISDSLPEDQEGIVTAELDLSMIGIENFFMDTAGHYLKSSAIYVELDKTPMKSVRANGEYTDSYMPFSKLQEEQEM